MESKEMRMGEDMTQAEPELTEEEIKEWQESIDFIKEYKHDMNAASWGYEEGLVISANQALACINAIKEVAKLKAELAEAQRQLSFYRECHTRDKAIFHESILKARVQELAQKIREDNYMETGWILEELEELLSSGKDVKP